MESSANFLEILNEKVEKFQKSFKDPEEAELVKKMWDNIQLVMATNTAIKAASPREQYNKVIQLLMQKVADSAGELVRALENEMVCKDSTNCSLKRAENDQQVAMVITREILYIWNRFEGD